MQRLDSVAVALYSGPVLRSSMAGILGLAILAEESHLGFAPH